MNFQNKISIVGMGSVSPLGANKGSIWDNYRTDNHCFDIDEGSWKANVHSSVEEELEDLIKENAKYKSLDRSVLLAILASRIAFDDSNWKNIEGVGMNLGSSRGATDLFEKYYSYFEANEIEKAHVLASPTTTLGNISSWAANDLGLDGAVLSHSVTCSTSFHAILNGIAWINSGMSNRFMVGGAEAPLTPFTIAQMKALKIYASNSDSFPCKSLDFEKTENSMILGEGASVFCLEKGENASALGIIEGVGFASEKLTHHVSMTDHGESLKKSMEMALGITKPDEIDVVVMHAPGTIQGDNAELKAVQNVFGENIPALSSNKWKIGHTLGASGALSLEFALLMLQHNKFIESPFYLNHNPPKSVQKVLINAVGFGGNAVSILLKK